MRCAASSGITGRRSILFHWNDVQYSTTFLIEKSVVTDKAQTIIGESLTLLSHDAVFGV